MFLPSHHCHHAIAAPLGQSEVLPSLPHRTSHTNEREREGKKESPAILSTTITAIDVVLSCRPHTVAHASQSCMTKLRQTIALATYLK